MLGNARNKPKKDKQSEMRGSNRNEENKLKVWESRTAHVFEYNFQFVLCTFGAFSIDMTAWAERSHPAHKHSVFTKTIFIWAQQ